MWTRSTSAEPIGTGPRGEVKHAAQASRSVLTVETLFRRHAEDVFRILGRLLGPGASREDLQDLTQQVFLSAHRALPRFREDSKPTTWLYGIASRVAMNHLRSRRRRRRLVAALEQEPISSSNPVASLESRQALRSVWRCLFEITPKKRIVYVMYELDGLSGKEIAEALGVSEATVRTRLFHARRELMERLAVLRENRR